MTIRLVKEPEIVLTESEYVRLLRQWESEQQYTAAPRSFEAWLRDRGHRPIGHAGHAEAPAASTR